MKTYTATVALNVGCYGTVEIEANSDEEAIAKLKELVDKDTLWDSAEPDWETCYDHRIVDLVELGTYEVILEDLYYGSDELDKTFD